MESLRVSAPSQDVPISGVGWNVTSPYLPAQQPAGAMNWCIGCIGEAVKRDETPSGIFESPGSAVSPASLYLEQLRERLGPKALENIGYPGAAQRVQ